MPNTAATNMGNDTSSPAAARLISKSSMTSGSNGATPNMFSPRIKWARRRTAAMTRLYRVSTDPTHGPPQENQALIPPPEVNAIRLQGHPNLEQLNHTLPPAAGTSRSNLFSTITASTFTFQVQRPHTQDDCKVLFHPLMVSLSNHWWPGKASFDKLRMSGD